MDQPLRQLWIEGCSPRKSPATAHSRKAPPTCDRCSVLAMACTLPPACTSAASRRGGVCVNRAVWVALPLPPEELPEVGVVLPLPPEERQGAGHRHPVERGQGRHE